MTELAYIIAAVVFIAMLARVLRLTLDLKKLKRQVTTECPHAWSPWEQEREINVWDGGEHPTGFLRIQQRTCALCRLSEHKQHEIKA